MLPAAGTVVVPQAPDENQAMGQGGALSGAAMGSELMQIV